MELVERRFPPDGAQMDVRPHVGDVREMIAPRPVEVVKHDPRAACSSTSLSTFSGDRAEVGNLLAIGLFTIEQGLVALRFELGEGGQRPSVRSRSIRRATMMSRRWFTSFCCSATCWSATQHHALGDALGLLDQSGTARPHRSVGLGGLRVALEREVARHQRVLQMRRRNTELPGSPWRPARRAVGCRDAPCRSDRCRSRHRRRRARPPRRFIDVASAPPKRDGAAAGDLRGDGDPRRACRRRR